MSIPYEYVYTVICVAFVGIMYGLTMWDQYKIRKLNEEKK